VDATGLAQGAVGSYFIRRAEHFGQKQRSWKHWLKWLAVVDVDRQIILAQGARQAPWNDCATLPRLVTQAHQHTPVGCVPGDAEFDSERNHTFCRDRLKANSIIPAKRFTSRRATGIRGQMRENFPWRSLWKTLLDRKRLLRHQTQTLLPRPWQNHRHTGPTGSPARAGLQPLSPPAARSCMSKSTEPIHL
jgi:hypothetical protein